MIFWLQYSFLTSAQTETTMKTIYVASPLGFSEVGRYFMYNKIIPVIEKRYKVLDPWKLTPSDVVDKVLAKHTDPKKAWQELNPIFGANNALAILKSNGIFAVLDGTDVDSGTASEIGFGAARRKPVLGYRGDFRLSADNVGSTVNLQVEYFIKLNGGKIITTLSNLEEELKAVFG